MRLALTCCCVAFFTGAAAAAPLTLRVTGTPGTGQVTMAFGGSQTASQGGVFGVLGGDPEPNVESQFLNLGDYTGLDQTLFGVVSGNVLFSVFDSATTTSLGLAAVLLDSDTNDDDDIGFSFGGATLPFLAGDQISLSGTVVVGGLDLTDLSIGRFTSSPNALNAALSNALDLEMTVAATPVPVPAPLPLLAGAAGLLAALRRRPSARLTE